MTVESQTNWRSILKGQDEQRRNDKDRMCNVIEKDRVSDIRSLERREEVFRSCRMKDRECQGAWLNLPPWSRSARCRLERHKGNENAYKA